MKSSKSKLTETLRKLTDGKTVYQARKIADVSVRRVYQVKEAFDKTGEIPQIGKDVGRPRKPFEEWEIGLVKQTYEKYSVSADTLERLIDRDHKKHMGHNRIFIIREEGVSSRFGDAENVSIFQKILRWAYAVFVLIILVIIFVVVRKIKKKIS